MNVQNLARLLYNIPKGREHATSIAVLSRLLQADERIIRGGIAQLVNEWREPVVTLPCRFGVFRPETDDDYAAADAHLRAKAMATLRRRRSLRLCRERAAYSETLF